MISEDFMRDFFGLKGKTMGMEKQFKRVVLAPVGKACTVELLANGIFDKAGLDVLMQILQLMRDVLPEPLPPETTDTGTEPTSEAATK